MRDDEAVTTVDTVSRANESGGSGSARKYNRDPRGTTTGGQFTAGSAQTSSRTPLSNKGTYTPQGKKSGGGSGTQVAAASSKFTTLAPGQDNSPEAVAQLQQLLTALGLGNLTSGIYDDATANAIKAAQTKLGIKPNGKANKSLVDKLLAVYDLSPCVKRSEDLDPSDLVRTDPLCEFTATRSEGDSDVRLAA
jgi:putative peptidoglycan binding protein